MCGVVVFNVLCLSSTQHKTCHSDRGMAGCMASVCGMSGEAISLETVGCLGVCGHQVLYVCDVGHCYRVSFALVVSCLFFFLFFLFLTIELFYRHMVPVQ